MNCGPRHQFAVRNNEGEVFIVHNSGGHGLNLHVGGCCTQVWFSLPDSLELWEQGNHRLARKGQTRQVTAHVLTVAGGVEEKLVRYLAGLARAEKQMIEDVRNG